jgi:hypothetical protein
MVTNIINIIDQLRKPVYQVGAFKKHHNFHGRAIPNSMVPSGDLLQFANWKPWPIETDDLPVRYDRTISGILQQAMFETGGYQDSPSHFA